MDTDIIIRKMLGFNMELITQEVADIVSQLKPDNADIIGKMSRRIADIGRTSEENASYNTELMHRHNTELMRSIDRLTRKVDDGFQTIERKVDDGFQKVENVTEALGISTTLTQLKDV
jgi:hypothetical protein